MVSNSIQSDDGLSRKAGGFFVVDINILNMIVEAGGFADDVLAYMVLSKGVNRRHRPDNLNRPTAFITSYGALAIHKQTGISYTKAEGAIKWLLENRFIGKAEGESIPAQLGKGKDRKHKSRWLIGRTLEPIDIALANALVDGIGRGKTNPPLMRIYNDIKKLGAYCGVADSRLDAIMVLAHLYRHHTFADCGGINPRSGLYRNWVAANNNLDEHATEVEGTNATLYEIEATQDTVFIQFASEALFYIKDETERHARFWEAFTNLKDFGLLYEVTQIWDANPNGSNGRRAEPLYTLYVHDRHARESEPYLQTDIHNLAFKAGAMDRYSEFSSDDKDFSNIKSGRHRYIANSKTGGYPIGIYRLRFRAGTTDTGIGMAAEKNRVNRWQEAFNNIAF
jgi:hypothetical protein